LDKYNVSSENNCETNQGFRSLIQADNFKLGKWKSHPVVNFPAKILKLFGFLRIMEIEKIFIFPATKECWRHREYVYARHFIQARLHPKRKYRKWMTIVSIKTAVHLLLYAPNAKDYKMRLGKYF